MRMGIAPTLFKAASLIGDSVRKLHLAGAALSKRAGDSVRQSTSPQMQPLQNSERDLEACTTLLCNRLDILQDAFECHHKAINEGATSFHQVHRLINLIRSDEIQEEKNHKAYTVGRIR